MFSSAWYFLLAAFPILLLLGLMVGLRWSALRAGLTAWLVCIFIAAVMFGLTFQVWWVSQAKGLLLSLYVLMVLWPALFLYRLVDQAGGIRAIADGLSGTIADRGLLLVVTAWAFSGALE
jgi:lactate permease